MSDIDRRRYAHLIERADRRRCDSEMKRGHYFTESAMRELVEVLRNLYTVTYFPKDVKVPDHKETLQKWEEVLTHYKDLPNEQT